MSLLWATFVVAAFAVIIELLALPERARQVATRSTECLRVLRDPALDDDTKERELRRQAIRLFTLTGILAGGSILAIALPMAVIWLLELGGAASLEEVLGVLARIDFLVGAAVVGTFAYVMVGRLRGS